MDLLDRFRDEWRARSREMRLAFVTLLVVTAANLALAINLSWQYFDFAGPAGILCGSHYYLVAILLVYMGFRMWSGDPLGWYGSLLTLCAVMAASAVEGVYGSSFGFANVGLSIFGIIGLMLARKHFWRHSIKIG